MNFNLRYGTILDSIKSDFVDEIAKTDCKLISEFVSKKILKNFLVFSDYYNIDSKLSISVYEMEVLRTNALFVDYLIKNGY